MSRSKSGKDRKPRQATLLLRDTTFTRILNTRTIFGEQADITPWSDQIAPSLSRQVVQ
jgi:hypothetical protein